MPSDPTDRRAPAAVAGAPRSGIATLLEPGLARLPYDELLDELLARTKDLCAADTATMLVADPMTADLVVRASIGLEGEIGRVIPAGEGIAGLVVRERGTVIVEDADELAAASPILTQLGVTSAAGTPMVVADHLIGAVVVGARREHSFRADDVAALELCAERLALATEHQRVTSSVRAEQVASEVAVARYRSLHVLGAALAGAFSAQEVVDVTLQHATSALGAAGAVVVVLDGADLVLSGSLGLADPVARRWSRFPLETDVPIAECIRDRRAIFTASIDERVARYPLTSADADPRYEASVSLPLIAAGTPIGAIGLLFTAGREFPDDDRELVEAVAQQCTQALARAQLYERERAASSRLRFLVEASELLLSSLDYETTLKTLVDAAVPELADWCSVHVSDEGRVRRLAVAHVDPAKVELARELHERYPFDPDAPTGVAAVLRTGEPEHAPDITEEMLDAVVPPGELREIMGALQFRSSLIVPLLARGRVVGALALVMAESGRRYGDDEVALVTELARIAAVAVDNAVLYRERSHVARALQSALLPPTLPKVPGLDLAARYLPSGSQAEVGGDFYDVFQDVGGQWAFVIGDVCGKGPEAAALTGLARYTVRAVSQHDPAPGAVLEAVNGALVDQVPLGRFATMGYARFEVADRGAVVTVASGGHPLALVRRPSGLVEAVGRPGMLVGITTPIDCPEDEVRLGPGDALLLYTDGLVERHKAAGGVEDGEPALRAVFSRCDALDAAAIADLILAVTFEAPDSARDDVALLVVRVPD